MTALQRDLATALGELGATAMFGLVGAGNFALAGAFRDGGGRYVGLRHEMNAVAAADAHARLNRTVGLATVTRGPGLTHAVTAIVEAVKSSTPLLVLAADTPLGDRSSNQSVDQSALATAIGAGYERWTRPESASAFVRRAIARAGAERRPIIVGYPSDAATDPPGATAAQVGSGAVPTRQAPAPDRADVDAVAALLRGAYRPCVLAGRGARLADAGPALADVAQHVGAILTTTVMANGLFAGHPFSAGVCGGFGDPEAAEVLSYVDLVLVVGASFNSWTTRHNTLFNDAHVIHVDDRAAAIGVHRPVDRALVADAGLFADALRDVVLAAPGPERGSGTPALFLSTDRQDFPPMAEDGLMDPRALTIALNELLPDERCVTVDGGHFSGWPVVHMSAIDPAAMLYPHGFQTVGLGLGSLVGVAIARPDRLAVGMVGDGGVLMSLGELDTLLTEQLPALVIVFNDFAYGAELHHFAGRPDTDLATLPERDFGATFRALGGRAETVNSPADLSRIRPWLEHPDGPLLLDCRISRTVVAPWLAFALGGHPEPVESA